MASKIITIALCFNDKKEAIKLSEKLKDIAPFINFTISVNFNDLLEVIGKEDNIDCFIVEENYKEYASEDLIRLLKESQRYGKSVFSLFSADLQNIDSKFLEMQLNYRFDTNTELNEVVSSLKRYIEKNQSPLIPKNFNVMVLDDNKDFLEVISLHLNELGHHNIDYYSSVSAAKKSLDTHEYDLLLLDWNLADGTCLDLVQYIKDNPVSARTKAAVQVIITGRNDIDDIMTLLDYGIKDYIIKPFDFSEFENKIDYAIEKNIKK
jgi:CheY-like chemotaxis protein